MSHNIDDLLEEIEILKGYKHMYQKLNEQNKRYREALEFYAKDDIYQFETVVSDCDIDVESKVFDDYGEKARQALGVGSND